MTKRQAEILHEIESDTHAVFDETFVTEVNEHFGTSITPRQFSESGPEGVTKQGPTGYSGPDMNGMAGWVIAEAIAYAAGCDSATWTGFHGRGRTCRAAIESVRQKLGS